MHGYTIQLWLIGLLVAIAISLIALCCVFFQQIIEFGKKIPRVVLDYSVAAGSSEFILKYMSNGGAAVAIRTMISGTILALSVFTISAIARNYSNNGSWALLISKLNLTYASVSIAKNVAANVKELCALYAAVYVTLYARFVNQWSYIANLYNQIKAAEIQINLATLQPQATTATASATASAQSESMHKLCEWKSGFIEDAIALHMDKKKLFCHVIVAWLSDANVMKEYVEHHTHAHKNTQNEIEISAKKYLNELKKYLSKI